MKRLHSWRVAERMDSRVASRREGRGGHGSRLSSVLIWVIALAVVGGAGEGIFGELHGAILGWLQGSDAGRGCGALVVASASAQEPITRGMPVQFRRVSQTHEGMAGARPDAAEVRKSGDVRIAEDNRTLESNRMTADGRGSRKQAEPIPLAPSRKQASDPRAGDARVSPWRSNMTMLASLFLIVGAGAAVVYVARRHSPMGRGKLPREVLETLGTASLNPRLEVHLVRLGGKLILIGAAPNAVETLAEVSDPEEVTRMVAACHAHGSPTVGASVRQALARLDVESVPSGLGATRSRRYSPGVADA